MTTAAPRDPDGASRRWMPAVLAVLAVALAPLAATSSFGVVGLAVLAVLTLASLGPWRPARAVALALVPCAAYAGGVASDPTPLLLLVSGSAAAVGVLLPQPRRALLALTSATVAVVLAIAMRVLSSGPWAPELVALRPLAAGLGFAAAAAGAVLCWRWASSAFPRLDRLPSALALLSLLVAIGRGLAGGEVPRSPAWHHERAALERARAGSSPSAVLLALDDLDAGGAADASYAKVALALAENADLPTIRALCPRGRRHVLDASWAQEVATGERACRLARTWPEEGARSLARVDDPSLRRLQGDLLMEAGLWQASVEAYGQAAAAGDRYAARDAVLALVSRGRLDDARRLAPAPDPAASLWLGGAVAPGDAWQAWNRLLDLDGLEPASRRGMRVVDSPGELPAVYDREVGRRVVVSRSRFGTGFGAALPPTPGGAVPRRLVLWMRAEGAFRIEVSGARDTGVTFSCQGDDAPPLPGAICSGRWDEVELPLDGVEAPLSSVVLRGGFRLARVQARP